MKTVHGACRTNNGNTRSAIGKKHTLSRVADRVDRQTAVVAHGKKNKSSIAQVVFRACSFILRDIHEQDCVYMRLTPESILTSIDEKIIKISLESKSLYKRNELFSPCNLAPEELLYTSMKVRHGNVQPEPEFDFYSLAMCCYQLMMQRLPWTDNSDNNYIMFAKLYKDSKMDLAAKQIGLDYQLSRQIVDALGNGI